MSEPRLPRIAITMGDPAGVGPEVVLKALADTEIRQQARYIVVGEAWVLEQTARQIGLTLDWHIDTKLPTSLDSEPVCILDRENAPPGSFNFGEISAVAGEASAEYIVAATLLCRDGRADAMTTGPVNKEAVTLSGTSFTGHTEFIADLCGGVETRMLLVNDRLRVVHVTTHCSLRDACRSDAATILRTITLGNEAMKKMGFARPRIAVCGLNPHAGEHGLFGREDQERILPAVNAARAQGIFCEGPLPADTLFFKAVRGAYDLIVAMYHDQGHIPMKLLDFEHTVNVSLGLPIIRTSVDHGTAFDIVGKNQADPASMKAALTLAATMAAQTNQGESHA